MKAAVGGIQYSLGMGRQTGVALPVPCEDSSVIYRRTREQVCHEERQVDAVQLVILPSCRSVLMLFLSTSFTTRGQGLESLLGVFCLLQALLSDSTTQHYTHLLETVSISLYR